MIQEVFVKRISSKTTHYDIKKSIYPNGHVSFNAICKPRNVFKLLSEYFTDFIGGSCIHPVFYSNISYLSLESITDAINCSNKEYKYKITHFANMKTMGDINTSVSICGLMMENNKETMRVSNLIGMVTCQECKTKWQEKNKISN